MFKDIKVLKNSAFKDKRGMHWTTWKKGIFKKIKFNHDKFSVSYKNVIRGIHYDNKTFKIVTAVYGAIDQVVVDMRKDSKTYKESLIFNIDIDINVNI